jgi:general secretion pathway protein I
MNRKSRCRNAAGGFTLVEVLVAVAIIALAMGALLVAMMRQVDGTAYLRDKIFAHWVALNQMELALLANAHTNQMPTEAFSGSEEMAGRTWYWRALPKTTANPGAIQLEISVSALEGKDQPVLASVSAILDSFHKL